MADIIHLLPDSVANQIAAGEVVQRPSSVVKELVENSIDAGARRIEVLLVEAGKTSIQVIDDGKGMSETDARRAFERHATSKIREAADLFSLCTMGFRGEALPSIAAVAQVELKTRTADTEVGTLITMEGGRVTGQEVTACPVGANFLVQNLFFNVPARRRFLKTTQTELSNVSREFERVALVNPMVHFTLTHNNNVLADLPVESMKQRISRMFGKKMGDQLLDIDVDTSLCKITGFVGRPDSAKKKGSQQFFFVNGRYMRHSYFHKAVMEAFNGLVEPTSQVPYFLHFDVDPSTIDVNIHPTKTEIKFENEVAIWQILLASVKEALGKSNAIPVIDFEAAEVAMNIPAFSATPRTTTSFPKVEMSREYNPFKSNVASNKGKAPKGWEQLYKETSTTRGGSVTLQQENEPAEFDFAQGIDRSTVHYQYRGQYILTTVQNGLMVVDQRRAHIRILYDQYRTHMEGQTAPTQRLLFPELVQVSPSDVPLMDEVQDELQSLGFELSSLGGGSYSVAGTPSRMEGVSVQFLFENLLADLKEGGQGMEEELHHRMALTMARNAAMEVGQVLSLQEMEALINQLFQSSNPNFGPDGARIIAIMDHSSIARLF
ncbi:MAG: DNA mismatch repair endonuclease MutL [Bacteroidaceae bacterium]|nr:DNA mismatch repair endonuclease MutL [Bacteroidaceae bacterium]